MHLAQLDRSGVLQAPQMASVMAVPDASLHHLEQLPPSGAEQPVGAAEMSGQQSHETSTLICRLRASSLLC